MVETTMETTMRFMGHLGVCRGRAKKLEAVI